jgi:hypothetical protein
MLPSTYGRHFIHRDCIRLQDGIFLFHTLVFSLTISHSLRDIQFMLCTVYIRDLNLVKLQIDNK